MTTLTEKDKAERYDLIIGYFRDKLIDKADKLAGEYIYHDEWKRPEYMDETEREEEVLNDFFNKLDDIGYSDFADLIAHDAFGADMLPNNQFYDHVYGDRPTLGD